MSEKLTERKRKKRSFKGLYFFIFFTITCAMVFSFLTKNGQQSFDAWRDRLQTNQNWLAFKLGQPLPGTPDLSKRDERLSALNLKMGAPIFMRVFKLEGQLELWMKGKDGFKLFATYPICRWSGRLGPKQKEGDRQSPEGFYVVHKHQLNPNSRWYRSFNLGYPNSFDKSYNRTGSFLMVHGGCSSIGCYAMTNPVMKEIWEVVTAAFKGGQKRFAVQAFPFRMTERNMRVYSNKSWAPFWQNLKAGYDLFEQSHVPPKVYVCNKTYKFKPGLLIEKNQDYNLKKQCPSNNGQLSSKT
jgi:murein L,D-transpeptidase YafK